jgi:hypothetical protein
MRACALAIILGACAASSPAGVSQQEQAGAFDVHVLKVGLSSSEYVPTLEIVAAKRISPNGPPGDRELRAGVGGRTFRVEFEEGSGSQYVTRRVDRFRYGSQGRELTLDTSEPWRWGRRPRHGTLVQGALLCEPVADPSSPFKALDVRAFVQRILPLLFTHQERRNGPGFSPDDWNSPHRAAARVLGSIPLREYLDPDQVQQILAEGTQEAEILAKANWTSFLRPLVALGHRETLEQVAKGASRGEPMSDGAIELPPLSRMVEDAAVLAYASSTDPEIRGLAGWVAAGTRDVGIYNSLVEDVRSGRAILPGDAAQREARLLHLERVRAWQSITAPLVTLGASLASIAAVMLLLRAATRRLL